MSETFPEPGGPVIVINVPGYSVNHLSTLLSASKRSFHAPSPISTSALPVLDDDEKKDNEEVNFDRISDCSAFLLVS